MFEKNSITYRLERTLRTISTLQFDCGDLSSISAKVKGDGNGELYACDKRTLYRIALIDTKATKNYQDYKAEAHTDNGVKPSLLQMRRRRTSGLEGIDACVKD